MLRADGARLGLKEQFSILDSDDVLGVLRDAGGTHRRAAGAPLAMGHQPVEEPGPGQPRALRARRRTTTSAWPRA